MNIPFAGEEARRASFSRESNRAEWVNDEGDDDDDLEGYEGSLWFNLLFWFD